MNKKLILVGLAVGFAGFVAGWWRGWRVGVDETIEEHDRLWPDHEGGHEPVELWPDWAKHRGFWAGVEPDDPTS